jgi:hypothetical protein
MPVRPTADRRSQIRSAFDNRDAPNCGRDEDGASIVQSSYREELLAPDCAHTRSSSARCPVKATDKKLARNAVTRADVVDGPGLRCCAGSQRSPSVFTSLWRQAPKGRRVVVESKGTAALAEAAGFLNAVRRAAESAHEDTRRALDSVRSSGQQINRRNQGSGLARPQGDMNVLRACMRNRST